MSAAPLLMALGARNAISRLIREGGDFDLFDAHYYYPDGAAVALLSSWFDKPFVVTARGTDLNLVPDFAVPRNWIRWTERRAAMSITVCRALMDRLVALGGCADRTRVLRNGVDLDRFRPLDRQQCRGELKLQDGRWMLSVGLLTRRKGHDIAIGALGAMAEDVRLAIVGEGEERANLARLADELGVSSRVVFAGARPQEELRRWYSAADVLVLCSDREGWPNVLLEALACATPVVATSVWGIPEVITSPVAGRLIDERTPAALASAVLDILSAPPGREAIRAYASRFDWNDTTRGQIDVFRTALREHVGEQGIGTGRRP